MSLFWYSVLYVVLFLQTNCLWRFCVSSLFVFGILCLSSFAIRVCGGLVLGPCFGIQYFLQSHCLWGLCVWPLFWYLVLYVVLAGNHLDGMRELVALLYLPSWCLVTINVL